MSIIKPNNVTFNQTMIRIKDPKISLNFYKKYFNMIEIHHLHFNDFSLYFLISSTTNNMIFPEPGTDASHKYLQSGDYGCTIELTHNYGTEDDKDFHYNEKMKDEDKINGFLHIGFQCSDLLNLKMILINDKYIINEIDNKSFSLLDPDGYQIYVEENKIKSLMHPIFHETTIRITNPIKSLAFYVETCKLKLLNKIEASDGIIKYYIGSSDIKENYDPTSKEAFHFTHNNYNKAIICLLYEEKFKNYIIHNGNTNPRGFGHLAFMVNDVYETSAELKKMNVPFQKEPNEGKMKGLAFIIDPDSYWIELVKRNMVEKYTCE